MGSSITVPSLRRCTSAHHACIQWRTLVNLSDLYCFSYPITSRLQLQLIVQIYTKLKKALGIVAIPAINWHTKTKHFSEFQAHTPHPLWRKNFIELSPPAAAQDHRCTLQDALRIRSKSRLNWIQSKSPSRKTTLPSSLAGRTWKYIMVVRLRQNQSWEKELRHSKAAILTCQQCQIPGWIQFACTEVE